MAKGMSSRSGPAPDPNALYGSKGMGEWVDLPADGRLGPAPAWPLIAVTVRELELWVDMWRRPQAVMWERNAQEIEVAMYIRSLVAAEKLDASVTSRQLLRQQMEGLGISLPGMLRNRWRIAASAVEETIDDMPARPSVRDRLKVVGDGLTA